MLSKMTNGEQLSLLCDQLPTSDTQGQPNAKPLEGEIDQERIRWRDFCGRVPGILPASRGDCRIAFRQMEIRGEGKRPHLPALSWAGSLGLRGSSAELAASG